MVAQTPMGVCVFFGGSVFFWGGDKDSSVASRARLHRNDLLMLWLYKMAHKRS